jgi:translocation and assembly module TamA
MTIVACLVRASILLVGFSIFLVQPLFGPSPALAADAVAIHIEGVEGRLRENVEAILRIPPGILQEDGVVSLPLLKHFEEDAPARVREALEPFGYYGAKSETHLRNISEHTFVLNVRVTPGEPVVVGTIVVGIEGPGKDETALTRLARRFPLHTGDILDQDAYEKAKTQMQGRAVDLGYLEADFVTHQIKVNPEEKKADIELVLKTGSRYFFGAFTFSGTNTYPLSFLKRYPAFKSGEPFSYTKLAETQANLRNSERFTDIFVTADREAAQDNRVPVDIKLADAPSRHLRIGAGYQTDTGPRFALLYQDLNVLDRGHQFDAELNIAELSQGVASRYTIPSSKSYLSYTVLKFNIQREHTPSYTTSLSMFEIDRERSLGLGRNFGVFLRFLYEDSDVGGKRARSYLTLPGIKFAAQQYNNPVRPSRGYTISGELRGTGQFLGSDQTFVQIVSQGYYVRRILSGLLLHVRAQIGLTIQRESINDIPASLRFFTGGDRSVRGYAYQSLGLKDDAGEVIGGKNLLVGSLELERSIGQDWGVAAFYDAGNAFNYFTQMRLFQGVGLGVRYYTKVGPIKLDLAHPIDKGSPVVRVHLSFGIGL